MSNTSLLGSYGGLGNSGLQFRNKLINGDFDVWQRGTSTSSTAADIFQADRWKTTMSGTNVNYTYARSTDIPNLASTYSARVTQTTGQNASSLSEYALRQVIEKQNTLGLVGKPITVSFWYKSNVTGTHGVRVIGNASGYTGGANQSQAFTVNAANTWEYKTLTFTAVQGVTAVTGDMSDIGMYLDIGPRVGGTVGQTSFAGDAYFSIAQIQMEAGPVATPFEHRPYGLELSLCQRYCYVTKRGGNASRVAMGIAKSTTQVDVMFSLPVEMRATPVCSLSIITNWAVSDTTAGYNITAFGDYPVVASPRNACATVTVASGLTAFRPYFFENAGAPLAHVVISAEL